MSMKISGRLLFPPLVSILILTFPAAVLYLELYQQVTAASALKERAVVFQESAKDLIDLTLAHESISRELTRTDPKRNGQKLLDLLKEQEQMAGRTAVRLQTALRSTAPDQTGRGLTEAAAARLQQYRTSMERASASAAIDRPAAISSLRTAEESFQPLRTSLRELTEWERNEMQKGFVRISSEAEALLFPLALLLFSALALSLAAGIILVKKMIASPLRAMEAGVQQVSRGNLSFDVRLDNRDEIGEVSRHLKTSFTELGRILLRIKELSARIAKVVEDVERQSKSVLKSTETEAAAIVDISSSIQELNAVASEIADSTVQLASSTGDSSASVEQMTRSISSINGSIHGLTDELASTSSSIEELSAAIDEIAAGADDLALASEGTLSAISEISASIREVEAHIQESARLSEKVTDDATTLGVTSIEKTIEGMKHVQESVEYTARFLTDLGKRSGEIGSILHVIDEITDSTTLLALNAAILAAQAGEHGKGFSVVADEIKALAEKTTLSTQEIASLIQAVQEGVVNTSLAMEQGIESVQEGFRLAQDTGKVLRRVMESSRMSSEMASTIERSTREQTRAAVQVTVAVAKVKDMTDHIAKATAEQSRGVTLIMSATEKMQQTFDRVKTATDEQAASSRQIRESVELVADGSKQISRALSEHRKSSQSILHSVEAVKSIPMENRDLIFRIGNALRDLQKDSELLKTETERFRFDEAQGSTLRLGVIPLEAPAEMFRRFAPLADFLTAKLGKRVEVKVGIDFDGAIDDIGSNVTQLCFMGAPTYLKAQARYGTVAVITRALRNGRPSHHGAIVTKADSDIQSLRDLRGRTVAFANVLSTAGHIIPRTILRDAGIDLSSLKYHDFLGHHDDAAKAVLKGDFDAACVMEATAYKYVGQGLKILQLSGDIPEFGMCVNVAMPPQELRSIQKALASLNDATPEGAAVIKAIDKNYTGFIESDDSAYRDIRQKMVELGIL